METLTENFNRKTINKINIIYNLAFDIQRKKLATVFVSYSGHVNKIDIRMYKNFDIDNMIIDNINNINFDFINLDEGEKSNRISLIIEYLQNCLIENEILIPSKELFKLY
jgi:hypothetical protein